MKIIIVDANILFSGILNLDSRIAHLLLSSAKHFQFFTTEFLRLEIERHKPKLAETAKLSIEEVDVLIGLFFKKIEIVSEATVPFEHWATAAKLVREIDPDDVSYVALNEHLDGKLWTGDQKLSRGLAAKGYKKCISTKEMLELVGSASLLN